MKPLGIVMWGLVIVFVDVRIDGLDLAFDPVGWVMCASGLYELRRLSSWFSFASLVAVAGVLVSCVAMVSTLSPLLELGGSLLDPTITFAICTGIIETCRHAPSAVAAASAIRWITVALAGALCVLWLDPTAFGGLLIPTVLVAVATGIWFLVTLYQVQQLPAPTAENVR